MGAGQTLGELINNWQDDNPKSDSTWMDSLIGQIKQASAWKFPQSDWSLIAHADSERWYAPILFNVCKSHRQGHIAFDVYFPRFEIDETSGGIRRHVPKQHNV